jgi:serine/threonine protein phosphatase PrpC
MICPGCSTEGQGFCATCGTDLDPESASATEIVASQQPLSPQAKEKMYYFSKPHVPITVAVAGATHVGNNPGKPNNEDRYTVISKTYEEQKIEVIMVLLLDGMGSYPGGEKWASIGLAEASACAEFQLPMHDEQFEYKTDEQGKTILGPAIPKWEFVYLIREQLSQNNLVSAMQSANKRIIRSGLAAELEFGKFGSTVAAGYLIMDLETGHVVGNSFNAGDARIAMVKEGSLVQLSKDHTIMGTVSRFLGAKTYTTDPVDNNKPLKHVVMGHKFKLELWMAEEGDGDVWILFYSDGLGNMLSPEAISAHLTDEPAAACGNLIEDALTITTPYARTLGSDKAFAGDDNVTVIAVRIHKVKHDEVQPAPEAPATISQGEEADGKYNDTAPQHAADAGGESNVHDARGETGTKDKVSTEDCSNDGTAGSRNRGSEEVPVRS